MEILLEGNTKILRGFLGKQAPFSQPPFFFKKKKVKKFRKSKK